MLEKFVHNDDKVIRRMTKTTFNEENIEKVYNVVKEYKTGCKQGLHMVEIKWMITN